MSTIVNANLLAAARRLEENLSLLDPAKHKVAHNLSFALLAICQEMDRIGRDVGANTTMLSSALKDMADEADEIRKTYRSPKNR